MHFQFLNCFKLQDWTGLAEWPKFDDMYSISDKRRITPYKVGVVFLIKWKYSSSTAAWLDWLPPLGDRKECTETLRSRTFEVL